MGQTGREWVLILLSGWLLMGRGGYLCARYSLMESEHRGSRAPSMPWEFLPKFYLLTMVALMATLVLMVCGHSAANPAPT